MSRARILADYVSSGDELALKAPLASPTFTGTTTVSGDLVPATPLSHRNMIINGAMQIAQRGTSSTGVTSGGYKEAPDRFTTYITSIGTYTISQSTDAPAGFGKSYKIDCTTADASPAASDNFTWDTRLEGYDLQSWKKGTSSALPVTLSFWVKSNKTGNGQVNLRDLDNSRQCGNIYTISSANTWEYKTITFPADTTGVFGDDNNNSLIIEWWIDSGSNFKSGTIPTAWVNNTDNQHRNVGGTLNLADSTANNWQITGVQLELGSSATPFEHRSYGDELERCTRYYQRAEFKQGVFHGNGHIRAITSTCFIVYTLQKKMRIAPSTITIPTIGQASGNFTFLVGEGYPSTQGSLDSTQTTTDHVFFYFTGFTQLGTAHMNTWAYVSGPANAVFTFDSEL